MLQRLSKMLQRLLQRLRKVRQRLRRMPQRLRSNASALEANKDDSTKASHNASGGTDLEHSLLKVFRYVADEADAINLKNLKGITKKLGKQLPNTERHTMTDAADVDKDSMYNEGEFCAEDRWPVSNDLCKILQRLSKLLQAG